MSEQVKEPKKEEKKPATTKEMVNGFVFLVVLAFIFYHIFSGSSEPDPIDFTSMNKQEIAKAIKELSPSIKDVTFASFKDIKGECIQINYRCDVSPNPIVADSDDLKNITQAIVTGKGSEVFSLVQFLLFESVVDKKNNKFDQLSAQIVWQRVELKGVNWEGFKGWQFLPLASFFEAQYPLGTDMVKTYCSDGKGFNDEFCNRPDVSRYLY